MAQTAYDFSYFEDTRQAPEPRVRAVKGKKQATNRSAAAKMTAVAVFMMVLIVAFVNSKVALNEVNGQIQTANKQMVSAQSEYNYLAGVLDSKTNHKNVEQIATGELGLVKIDKSQITYFELDVQSEIQLPENKTKLAVDFFSTGMLSLMDYLNP